MLRPVYFLMVHAISSLDIFIFNFFKLRYRIDFTVFGFSFRRSAISSIFHSSKYFNITMVLSRSSNSSNAASISQSLYTSSFASSGINTPLNDNGFVSVSLGKRVLRVETAAIYVASILNFCNM